jgi:hypothetical protein
LTWAARLCQIKQYAPNIKNEEVINTIVHISFFSGPQTFLNMKSPGIYEKVRRCLQMFEHHNKTHNNPNTDQQFLTHLIHQFQRMLVLTPRDKCNVVLSLHGLVKTELHSLMFQNVDVSLLHDLAAASTKSEAVAALELLVANCVCIIFFVVFYFSMCVCTCCDELNYCQPLTFMHPCFLSSFSFSFSL